MRHRHRPAAFNLLFKQRDHAAVTAEYIPEAHGYELRLRAIVVRLDDHLAYPLCRAHDVCRIDCLVRRDHHKTFDMMPVRRLDHLPGAKHIVFYRLIGAVLHKGHMLVRRRMVDNVRLIHGKNIVNTLRVTHRRNQYLQGEVWIVMNQFLLDTVCIVLININNNQLLRPVRCNLTAQLASDGAAAARDKNHLPRYIVHDGAEIYAYRLPPQQVVDIDLL